MKKINIDRAGIVVIGRNEGERLRRCLESSLSESPRVIYVDSGSTDHSTLIAHELGADVVDLDMTKKFCAARARNVGYEKLRKIFPDCEFVQFIDGDCEFCHGWLKNAVDAFMQKPDVAIVAGNLSEKDPSYSIYNRLAELEWNFDGCGEVNSVGGIFMIRRSSFDMVSGFDSSVAAGEEPELCNRLTENGWKIIRLASDMAIHDLAMTNFRQWWIRQVRGGYGGLDVAQRFGLKSFVRNSQRARIWGLWLLLSLLLTVFLLFADFPENLKAPGLIFIGLWPLQLIRIAFRTWRKGESVSTAVLYAWFTMVSFWPQMIGQLYYQVDKVKHRSHRLIEYKKTEAGIPDDMKGSTKGNNNGS